MELGTRLNCGINRAVTIESVQRQLQQAQDNIDAMEDKAARTPNRQAVFRYADGRVVKANGEELPPEIAEGIIWPDNAPSAEDYFAAKDRRDALADHLASWHTYRIDVLGDIRDRYDDHNNPLTKSEIGDALKDIASGRPAPISQIETSSPTNEATRAIPAAFPTIGG